MKSAEEQRQLHFDLRVRQKKILREHSRGFPVLREKSQVPYVYLKEGCVTVN